MKLHRANQKVLESVNCYAKFQHERRARMFGGGNVLSLGPGYGCIIQAFSNLIVKYVQMVTLTVCRLLIFFIWKMFLPVRLKHDACEEFP